MIFQKKPSLTIGRIKGFTLWECCIGMLLIVLTFAVGNWSVSLSPAKALKKELDLMHVKLRETRSLAAMNRRPARLLIHADDRQPDRKFCTGVIQLQSEQDPLVWVTWTEVWDLNEPWMVIPKEEDARHGEQAYSSGMNRVKVATEVSGWASDTECYVMEFKPTGRISSASYLLVIGQKNLHEHELSYLRYRGLRVNSYGQICQLHVEDDYE